jgi:hypothetical protein
VHLITKRLVNKKELIICYQLCIFNFINFE